MGMGSIPVRLTLAESGAVALDDAARDLDAACDADTFITALDRNHRLWLALGDVASRQGWGVPDHRLADFVVAVSERAGCGVRDQDVETLIGINRDLAKHLVSGHDVEAIRRRVRLAWEEAGPQGQPFATWLINELRRRASAHQ